MNPSPLVEQQVNLTTKLSLQSHLLRLLLKQKNKFKYAAVQGTLNVYSHFLVFYHDGSNGKGHLQGGGRLYNDKCELKFTNALTTVTGTTHSQRKEKERGKKIYHAFRNLSLVGRSYTLMRKRREFREKHSELLVTWQGPVLSKDVDYSRPYSLPRTKAPHPSHSTGFYPVGLSGPRSMISFALTDLTHFSHLFRALLHSKKHSRRSCLF